MKGEWDGGEREQLEADPLHKPVEALWRVQTPESQFDIGRDPLLDTELGGLDEIQSEFLGLDQFEAEGLLQIEMGQA